MAVMSLFVCAGLLAGVDPAAAREDGRAIVRKPLYDLFPTSRFIDPAGTPQPGYTKRAVGLSGESRPAQIGTSAGSPAIMVERIIVTGGRVEITAASIVIDGGRVEIIRQSDK